jgi:hypothetical protein
MLAHALHGSDCVIIGSYPTTISLMMQGETGVVCAIPVDHHALSLGPVGSSLLKHSWFDQYSWDYLPENTQDPMRPSAWLSPTHTKTKITLTKAHHIYHHNLSSQPSHTSTFASFITIKTQKNQTKINRYLKTYRYRWKSAGQTAVLHPYPYLILGYVSPILQASFYII